MTVPAPTLKIEGTPDAAPLEMPVNLSVAGVNLADGSPFEESSLGTAAYLVFREKASGSPQEIWDKELKAWASGDGTGTKGEDLAFKDGNWNGILVAAGKQDKDGKPQFEKHLGGYPRYLFAGSFADKSGNLVVGPKSPPVSFISASDKNLIGVLPKDGEKPESATQARLFLKSDPSRTIGQVRIENDASLVLETFNPSGGVMTSLTLNPDGSIRLKGRLIVDGDIEVGHVSYLDAGNARKELP
ncbi:hypothetical protein EON82_08035 [bacterium]|nr:MAG: hypothetical protein EON82_08035 [bacterium]